MDKNVYLFDPGLTWAKSVIDWKEHQGFGPHIQTQNDWRDNIRRYFSLGQQFAFLHGKITRINSVSISAYLWTQQIAIALSGIKAIYYIPNVYFAFAMLQVFGLNAKSFKL